MKRLIKFAKFLSVSYCRLECHAVDLPRHKRLCVPVMVKEKGRWLVASRDSKVGNLLYNNRFVVSIKKNFNEICYDIVKRLQKIHAT